jgi:RNA polymerase sigma-70 factor, ECF subfamily
MRESPAPELVPAVFEQAKRGDEAAFEAIVRHYDPGLRALAFRLLGHRDLMDDALQEAYVKAFRALPRFRGDSKLGTWLYRIVYNACLDQLGAARRVVTMPLEHIAEHGDLRPGVVEAVADRSELAAALGALSPADRAAVLMVDAHGFSYADAADALGVPEGTIASRLNRARALLRDALQRREEASEQ